mmetsp:Transcript_27544/g.62324  ORF Transcript_27544/g.62324 Transcript_27544/m.62324 type:complete len:236 (-) Transcript_27544:647-1354(-)
MLERGALPGVLEQVERRLDVVFYKGHWGVDRVVDVRLGGDVEDHLHIVGVQLVEKSRGDWVREVKAKGLQQMKDASVSQPVVTFGRVRELVDDDQLVVGVLGKVLNDVVTDEPAAAGDDAPLALPRRDRVARGRHQREVCLLREIPHGGDDALPILVREPPAHREADELIGQDVELGQQYREALHAAVHVVALVDRADGDALLLHHLYEIVAALRGHAERVQPPRRGGACWQSGQ